MKNKANGCTLKPNILKTHYLNHSKSYRSKTNLKSEARCHEIEIINQDIGNIIIKDKSSKTTAFDYLYGDSKVRNAALK